MFARLIKALVLRAGPKKSSTFIYGHDRTIHHTGTIDIQLDEDGKVVRVWYRCLQLPFRVSHQGSGKTLYEDLQDLPAIEAIEVKDWR